MILITYIKPFVVINSDKLITGNLNIIDTNENIALTEKFKNRSYFNIEIDKEYGDTILVVLETKDTEVRKRITINSY